MVMDINSLMARVYKCKTNIEIIELVLRGNSKELVEIKY